MSEAAVAPKLRYEELTEKILGAAIEVHKTLGPGLLESAYEECLCLELNLRGLRFERQLTVPVSYKGINLDCGYKLDLLVEDTVIGTQVRGAHCIDSRSSTSYLHEVAEKAGGFHHKFQRSSSEIRYRSKGFMNRFSPCLRASVVIGGCSFRASAVNKKFYVE